MTQEKYPKDRPVFRFAPSPNGRLHLGHAYSALLNQKLAREVNGVMLLRIEDTDLVRCTPVLEQRMLEDLNWLGFQWDDEARRQSDHLDVYQNAISRLQDMGLVYPAFMSRREIREFVECETSKGENWPCDPDGVPHYPNIDRYLARSERDARIASGEKFSLRLDMAAAVARIDIPLFWNEEGKGTQGQSGRIDADAMQWGDIVLSGKDYPASYHLASVVDDALCGVSHIVRGRDLFDATAVHRVLQNLLGYHTPIYFHHDLILDKDGNKLSKSRNDTSLAELRAAGASPQDIRQIIGLDDIQV